VRPASSIEVNKNRLIRLLHAANPGLPELFSIPLPRPFMRELTEEEAYQTVAFMEKLVVGLGSLGRHYADNNEDLAWGLLYMFTPKLVNEAARVRGLLLSKYNTELAEGEDLDELDKLFINLTYRKALTPKQLARFRRNRLKK
jgi:hypothetical protein